MDNEQEWILIHENDSNVAICFVYLAAEVGGDNFQVWNAELCAMLQSEITISEDGYMCSLVGDFNRHIGWIAKVYQGTTRTLIPIEG